MLHDPLNPPHLLPAGKPGLDGDDLADLRLPLS